VAAVVDTAAGAQSLLLAACCCCLCCCCCVAVVFGAAASVLCSAIAAAAAEGGGGREPAQLGRRRFEPHRGKKVHGEGEGEAVESHRTSNECECCAAERREEGKGGEKRGRGRRGPALRGACPSPSYAARPTPPRSTRVDIGPARTSRLHSAPCTWPLALAVRCSSSTRAVTPLRRLLHQRSCSAGHASRSCRRRPSTPALPAHSHPHTGAARGSSSRVERAVVPFADRPSSVGWLAAWGGSGIGSGSGRRAALSLSQALRWPNEKTNGGKPNKRRRTKGKNRRTSDSQTNITTSSKTTNSTTSRKIQPSSPPCAFFPLPHAIHWHKKRFENRPRKRFKLRNPGFRRSKTNTMTPALQVRLSKTTLQQPAGHSRSNES
jgi:hypothetical protein